MAREKAGSIFSEVVFETKNAEKELTGFLSRAAKEAAQSKNFQPMVEAAGEAGRDASREFTRRFTLDARGRLHDERGRFVSMFTGTFGRIGIEVGESFFSRFLAGFAAAARGAPLTGGLLSFGSQILTAFTSLGVPGLVGGLASFLPILGVLVVVVPLLVSAIFALGGALASLVPVLGIIPGLLAGILVTVIPLVVAFQGMGDAISAMMSGDLDKFNEALKKLAPSARVVVKELQALMPFFSGLRRDTQQAFFTPLIGALTELVDAAGPAVSGGMQNIAFAIGSFLSMLAKFASQPATVDFLARLFESVTNGITEGGPTIIRFLESMVAIANVSLPIIETLFGKLGGGLDRFSKFLKDSANDGSFARGLESGLLTLEKIWNVGSELFGLLKDMFGETDESGQTFLDDVAEAIRQLREFFQSPDGKQFIENMITLAGDFGKILIFVAGNLALIIGFFGELIELADKLGNAWERVANIGKRLGPAVSGSPGGALSSLAAVILGLPGFAAGGITNSLALAHPNEAILPLDDPARAREVASDPRVAGILGGGDMTFIGVFDGEPFQARIVRTVRGATKTTARQLSQKPRG